MSEHTTIWDALKTPPSTALKPITGGRLNGKTDINPQWRLQAMTELFGPVGEGWTYQIQKVWTVPGADGEIAAFAQVAVRYRLNGCLSEPIEGIGGSMLVEKEKNGLHTSDEAFKMAVTDALSVALKALGVAADVYLGLMESPPEGGKYDKPTPPALPRNPLPKPAAQVAPTGAAGSPPERPKATHETFKTGLVNLASLMCLEVNDAFSHFVSWAGTRIPGGLAFDWTDEQVETAVTVLREFYAHVRGGSYNA